MLELKGSTPAVAVDDQASGLRRMFGTRPAQVIAFVASREACGRTSLLVKTASALAKSGLSVVLIDENSNRTNVHAAYGLVAENDLFDLAKSQQSAKDISQAAAPLVSVVAAQRFASEIHHIDLELARRLDTGLRQLHKDAAFVLVDCAIHQNGDLSLLALAAQHIAVVVAAESSAITQAYALIKRLARERGSEGFHIVVTRARNEMEAEAIFKNMRRTAQEHLGVRLEYLCGAQVPESDHLADVLMNRLPVGKSSSGHAGFLPFLAPRPVRRMGPGLAGYHLESVV